MSVEWSEVPEEVLNRAERLIEKYHSDLLIGHDGIQIAFVFRSKEMISMGVMKLGNVSKVSEKDRAAGLEYDFVIWLAESAYTGASEEFKDALIDHELCHIVVTDNGFGLCGHDFQDFIEIVERYGAWNMSLMRVLGKQLDFPELKRLAPQASVKVCSFLPTEKMKIAKLEKEAGIS